MSYGISDLAVYLPARVLDNAELVERFKFEQRFLDEKIGIRRRHIAAADESVSDMAVSASQALLARGTVAPADIGALVLCTQNPDYRLPTTANLVQDRLGLPNTVAAFDINQGCSGYIYGLSVISAFMAANDIEAGLLITSEAYSKVIDPNDRDTVPLFGDGASATLVRRDGPGKIGLGTFGSDGSGGPQLIVRGGGSRHPDRAPKGEDALHMNGRAVFEFMMRRIPPDVRRCLERNNLTAEQVDLFLFHQASRFMVRSLTKALGLPESKVPIAVEDTGNTVSSTIPVLIDRLGGLPALKGKTVLVSGFGVGLSWASTILRFS